MPLPAVAESKAHLLGSDVVIFSAATAAATASCPGPNGEAVDLMAGREDPLGNADAAPQMMRAADDGGCR